MRTVSILLALLLASWTLATGANPVGKRVELSDRWQSGDRYQGVVLLGALLLRGDPALAELSGLGWDEDEGVLYAITDRGLLLHLLPQFADGHLRGVELLASHRLRGGDDRPLPTPLADAEGLVVVQGDNGVPGDSHLLISFERNQRIARHLPDGRQVARLALPEPLRDPGRYRAPNNGLEAVTLHPRHGLISGPEFAADTGPIPLYASDGTAWHYQPTRPDGGLVGLETLPDGSLLLLERAYSFPLQPWAITLSRARLPESGDTAPLDAAPVVTFDSADGWRVHNIEAISRHRGSRLFLASDDGGEGLLQTQLIYLELQ